MYRCIRHRQVVPQTVQELTDALIQVWEEIPQQSTVSSGACPDIIESAYRHVGAIRTTEPHYEFDQPVITVVSCFILQSCYGRSPGRWENLNIFHSNYLLFSQPPPGGTCLRSHPQRSDVLNMTECFVCLKAKKYTALYQAWS